VIVDHEPARRVPRHRPRPLGRALVTGALAAWIGWGLAGGVGATSTPTAVAAVVVRPGDTVWSIAAGHAAGGDIRDEVAEIISLNRLSSPIIQPGETLRLPAG